MQSIPIYSLLESGEVSYLCEVGNFVILYAKGFTISGRIKCTVIASFIIGTILTSITASLFLGTS